MGRNDPRLVARLQNNGTGTTITSRTRSRSNGHARLGVGHDFAKLGRRGVDLGADVQRGLGSEALFLDERFRGDEALVDGDVSILRVLHPPFVGEGV